MINVVISSFNVAVALDNTLRMVDKPALGQEEIVFNNFEELREFTEEVLSRMGLVIED
jgi:hypothetical protein